MLAAKNLQEWTESTSDEFAAVLFKLNTIVDNAETLVRKMSPAVKEAIERQTTVIKVELCRVEWGSIVTEIKVDVCKVGWRLIASLRSR